MKQFDKEMQQLIKSDWPAKERAAVFQLKRSPLKKLPQPKSANAAMEFILKGLAAIPQMK